MTVHQLETASETLGLNGVCLNKARKMHACFFFLLCFFKMWLVSLTSVLMPVRGIYQYVAGARKRKAHLISSSLYYYSIWLFVHRAQHLPLGCQIEIILPLPPSKKLQWMELFECDSFLFLSISVENKFLPITFPSSPHTAGVKFRLYWSCKDYPCYISHR